MEVVIGIRLARRAPVAIQYHLEGVGRWLQYMYALRCVGYVHYPDRLGMGLPHAVASEVDHLSQASFRR